MQKISKFDFWNLIKPELAYFNKKWQGATEEEKKSNERTILKMYYDSLCHATQKTLEMAFRVHRQNETTFPKIANILRHAPREVIATEMKKSNHNPVEMPKNVAKMIESSKKKTKIDKHFLGEMKVLTRLRWPNTDWDETFARWDSDNQSPKELNAT